MILNYYIRHNLTQEALEDLLRMMNTISGTKFVPESFQTFTAMFDMTSSCPQRVFFCTECQYDYGTNHPEPASTCPICESSRNDFFLVIPLEHQLREMFKKYHREIEQYALAVERDKIADINRGKNAQNVLSNDSGKHITISINTDGAAAFKSTTRKPLYPIFCTLNDLPPVIRFQKSNLIVAGLWLSKGEPNPNLLFKYLCLELRKLEEGMLIGTELYKVHLLQICLDSVARCKVQCNKQFNGEYGCTLCLHPGETRSSGNARCYPARTFDMRNNVSTRKMMDEVKIKGRELCGITGKSVFTYLETFDIIAGYPVDYMHAVDLGVFKQIITLLTGSENHKQEYYIGRQTQAINGRIGSIRPPSSFPRSLRLLDEQKQYKANEWEAFLLYYIYPCLYGILKEPFLDHIMELSSTIFLLLDPTLTSTTIDHCEQRIAEFVKQFEAYYGSDNMTYNIHLLTHLAFTARNTGAIYNSSLYPYESGNYHNKFDKVSQYIFFVLLGNGMLLKFRSGNNKPIIQIERKYQLNRMIHMTHAPKTSIISPWIRSLWTKQHPNTEYTGRLLFSINGNLTYEEGIDEKDFSTHDKIYFNGINLCTKSSCQNYQYDDSWICKSGSFYNICNILSDKQNTPYIVGQVLTVEQVYENLYKYTESNSLKIVKIDTTIQQCINMVINCEDEVIKFVAKCKVMTQAD